jgi:hypothetical protein
MFARWCSAAGALVVLLSAIAIAQAESAPPVLQTSVLAMAPPTAPPVLPSPVPENGFVSFFRDGEWYFSFGSNKEFWSNTDIHVSQPSLGNNFTIYDVSGHDAPLGAGEAPQFNVRIGRFFNENFGVELSLDHSKYYTNIAQNAVVAGTLNGLPVNANYQLTNTFFNEVLHNGANHFMIDGVYRYPLYGRTNETYSVAALGKAGAGLMLPHTSDTIEGNSVDVGQKTLNNLIGFHSGWWQVNGWTAGAEVGLRVVLYKPFYLEVTDKVAYSSFFDLPAYQGTLQQSMWINEVIVTLGITYDGTSKSPLGSLWPF